MMVCMTAKKIGFFGGSFDPVHLGHINLLEHVDDQSQGRLGWIHPGVLCLVFLQDVVLNSPTKHFRRYALSLGSRNIETKENDRRTIDGHGHRHLIEGDALEQPLHVGQ